MTDQSPLKDWSLVADIGGTNARFARKLPGKNSLMDQVNISVSGHANFIHALASVLEDFSKDETWSATPSLACFAVACRVDHEEISFLNSPWAFTRSEVKNLLGSIDLDVINDFAANGYGIGELSASDWLQVGGHEAIPDKPVVIIGPGTGLGVSLVVPRPEGNVVVDGEGGHVDFAPTDALEYQVLEVLKKQFGRVSVERLLSGSGILNIYQALAAIEGVDSLLQEPEAISGEGIAGTDPLAEQTMSLFCAVLGSVAGNLALTTGALGGVYIAGGIVPGMVDFLSKSDFRERFDEKGRYRDYMKKIPTRVIIRHDLGLIGAGVNLTQHGH